MADIVSPAWSDDRDRDAVGEAERVLRLLGVREGTRVADLGAGTGYYAMHVARRVGAATQVLAQDISLEFLRGLERRALRERLANVRTVLGLPADPRLPAGSVDVALLSHVYHEIEDPYGFLWRLVPAFAPGGRLAIIDMDRPTDRHGTPPALLRCELGRVGYREVAVHDLRPADGYLAVFEAPTADARPAPGAIVPCGGETGRP